MPSMNVLIDDELNSKLEKVAKTCGSVPADVISKFIEVKLEDFFIDFIILRYKEGALTARNAWKATGLEYAEFQKRVQ